MLQIYNNFQCIIIILSHLWKSIKLPFKKRQTNARIQAKIFCVTPLSFMAAVRALLCLR